VRRRLGWSPDDPREFLERTEGGMIEEWSDWPYRIVWRIPGERPHVTFCEGDVSLLEARSDEDFEAIDASADRFYGWRES
jgi:hypothetical protein